MRKNGIGLGKLDVLISLTVSHTNVDLFRRIKVEENDLKDLKMLSHDLTRQRRVALRSLQVLEELEKALLVKLEDEEVFRSLRRFHANLRSTLSTLQPSQFDKVLLRSISEWEDEARRQDQFEARVANLEKDVLVDVEGMKMSLQDLYRLLEAHNED
jgi:hypothetical protein